MLRKSLILVGVVLGLVLGVLVQHRASRMEAPRARIQASGPVGKSPTGAAYQPAQTRAHEQVPTALAVRVSHEGQGVGGIPIRLYSVGSSIPLLQASTETGVDGSIDVPAQPGAFVVYADGRGQGLARVGVRVLKPRGEASTSVEIVLTRARTLRGKVVDATDRSGIPFASVEASPLEVPVPAEEQVSVLTGPRGEFTLEGLCDGAAEISVRADGYAPRRESTKVSGDAVLEIALDGAIALSGFVVDERGAFVPGAKVIALSAQAPANETTTGAGGGFALEVAQGTYQVLAREGLRGGALAEPLSLLRGQSAHGLRIVVSSGGTIAGTLVHARTGEPIQGGQVALNWPGYQGSLAVATSDGAGQFSLSGLPNPPLSLIASHPRMVEQRLTLEDFSSSLTLRLEPTDAAVTGVAKDEEGRPLANVRVQLRRSQYAVNGEPRLSQITGDDGRFEFSELEAGRITLTASQPDSEAELIERLVLSPGEVREQSFSFQRRAVLEGRVDGIPPGAPLTVTAHPVLRTGELSSTALATISGQQYRMELYPGSFLITAQAGERFLTETVDIGPGEQRELNWSLADNSRQEAYEDAFAVEAGTVGATFETRAGSVYVAWMQQRSPAKRAGIEEGSLLVAVDGVSVQSSLQAYQLSAGEPGSEVKLTVRSHGADSTVTLRRQERVPKAAVVMRRK